MKARKPVTRKRKVKLPTIFELVAGIALFVWQGKQIGFGIVPMKFLKKLHVNPVGRIDPESKKLKTLARNLFGSGNVPGVQLYSYPIIDQYGNVIDGHGRISVFEKAGVSDIPCHILFDVDPVSVFFTVNDKDLGKKLSYNDHISCLSRGLSFEQLPKKLQRDYKKLITLLPEEFIKENLIIEGRDGVKVPSFFTVNKLLSAFSGDSWFGSKDTTTMFKCYHWLFVLKNQEAMRAIGGFKSSFKPSKQNKELIMKSIRDGGKLVINEATGVWESRSSNSEDVKKRVKKHNDFLKTAHMSV